jgi:hypothetical protein
LVKFFGGCGGKMMSAGILTSKVTNLVSRV